MDKNWLHQGSSDHVYSEFYRNSHVEGRYTAYIRGARCYTDMELFKEYSAAFQFPPYFGENWNAWDECACDLAWICFSSIAIVIDHYELMFCMEQDQMKSKRLFEDYLKELKQYWEVENNVPCYIIAFEETNNPYKG